MRSLLISGLVVLLAAAIQAEVFNKEKVTLGKKTCLCDFNIKIGDTCSGSAKCDKKCSASGTVELGGCSFTLAVKKGKGKISKCSCEAAPTIIIPTVPIPTSPGSGSEGPPPPGGEGMQCLCKCNCPDGSGECDCDCNCPMTSKALTCAAGFSKVCPMMGDICPEDMDPICPYNAMSRMAGNADGQKDKGCQCVPDFLLAMVMIQPTARMDAVDRAKATFQVGKKKCKCSYKMNQENCKKSKIACDKKCSGKATDLELADGDVMYMVDVNIKKGKVTINKCASVTTGTGGGCTGSGSGNGEGGIGGMGSKCACVSRGMGGSGPTAPTLPPTGSGSDCRCGMKKPNSRVVGGQNATAGEYPWMALIAFANETGDIVSMCGGTIINSKWIITARHCLFINFVSEPMYPTSRIEVFTGVHDDIFGNFENRQNALPVKEIVVSPTQWDDFALIKVEGEIDTGIHTPICLPKPGDDFRNMDAVLTGWGHGKAGFINETTLTEVLQEITLPILSAAECNQYYATAFNLAEVFDIPHSLCFGGQEDKSACFADNGGPLIVQKKDTESWTLAGVFNGIQEPCAKEGNYGLALNVANFVDFIKTTAADGNFCN